MKFSKTISIEESHLHNIKELMAVLNKSFAQVSRLLIGYGLQKYHETRNNKTVTTTVISPESEKPPQVEKIKEVLEE